MNVVERHAPLRTKRVRNSKSPWISVELKQRMRERDFLKTKAIKTQDPLDWAVFKRSRNFVNSQIKHAKETHYKTILLENENNVRKTWSIINELTSRKQKDSRVKEILVDGSPIIDANQLSEYFNDHFANIGPKLAENIPTIENLSFPRFPEYFFE